MTLNEVMAELESYGSDQTKRIYENHNLSGVGFGVKVQDMKKIQKKIKRDYKLSLELFDTLNPDAMYFAGLISDPLQMTKADLNDWANKSYWSMISEHTVAGALASSPYALELANEWIESSEDKIASAGWAALGIWVALTPNEQIDIQMIKALLDIIPIKIESATNRVKYTMNGFIIMAGSQIPELTEYAKAIGGKVGKVKVDMGKTACKVPNSVEYIEKIEKAGRIGNKRKSAFC